MRIEASVTSISWLPSEAIQGVTRLPFDLGITHYDAPPSDVIEPNLDALDDLSDDDRFRFANHLSAWIEVDDGGRIVGHGQDGGGLVSRSCLRKIASAQVVFTPLVLPELRPAPVVGGTWVRFRQTAGGRTGLPSPRLVGRWPFVQWKAPWVWTSLELTIHADGRVEQELVGATPFPRHWLYDRDGRLVAKSGLAEFGRWSRYAFGRHSPWDGVDWDVLMADAETPLERRLSAALMRTTIGHPDILRFDAGSVLMTEG